LKKYLILNFRYVKYGMKQFKLQFMKEAVLWQGY